MRPILIWLLLLPLPLCAQEYTVDSIELADQGERYVESNFHALSRYQQRMARVQQRLLARLARKERRMLVRLKRTDSLAYQRLSHSLSFDSLKRLSRPDSVTLLARTNGRVNNSIDSLKKVQAFLQQKAGALPFSTDAGQFAGKLDGLNQQLSYQQYLSDQINQRSNALKSLTSGLKDKVPGITGIEKDVFYAKSKIKAWKEVADEPSKLEERALEYLQGTDGFENAFTAKNSDATGAGSSVQAGLNADQLEALGFQTKRQLQQHLQQQFGNQLSGVQQQLAGQVEQYTKPLKEASSLAKETKQSLRGLKNTQKPSFKINLERGKPFWQRLEKGYALQTLRATGDRPALLDISAQVAFRHTPSLSYGLGMIGSFGLGRDWSHIRFTFEGVGGRAFAQWQWKFGFGAYAGYERLYKKASFGNNESQLFTPSTHNTAAYSESLLAGIQKSYHINSKWNGAIQVLADVWWKEKGLRLPILLRFTTTSK